ncbi:quinone oxidoreductase family protein [Hyphomonas oceanitis]|uniref:Putative Zn-dependent oxidoreductase n=1 Tax=Hyphomonas oceanitis SCH89 TaxID=1280953 RepID=A0A059G5X2_9PROT|nr:zinc-binding dehydrogenase [Hyphomonas oceanitis]KDA01853.1 Putative Zn-dependent oxidoreductase [Hyphomonas oceanitis SCH89]
MRAVNLNNYGGTENFEVVDVSQPTPSEGEVLIRVGYAGLRWGDIMQRNGFPTRERVTPFIGGQEAAGVIEATGPGVSADWKGRRVVAMVPNGAFGEYCVAAEQTLFDVPDSVSLDTALAYPINLRTAYMLVYEWAKVQPGETVLVHAAAGGVGHLAVQIMKRKLWDVRVIGIVSSKEKEDLLLADGCDYTINRKTQDYVEEVNKICGPKFTGFKLGGQQGGGVDVSMNGVSGETLQRDPRVIRKRGRWVIYGYAGGRGELDTSAYGYDGITIMPFSSLAWLGTEADARARTFVRDWLKTERLVTPQVYKLEDVAKAQDDMEAGRTTGKVVFQISQ